MTEKYIVYRNGDDIYDIAESDAADFESQYPDATIEMHDGDDIYDISISDKADFLNQYPNAVYAFGEENEKKSKRQHRWDDKTTLGESIVKGAGSAAARTGKQLWDALLVASSNSVYIDPHTGIAERLPSLEQMIDEGWGEVEFSNKLGEAADRLSKEADPTGGEKGYIQLLKEGKLGQLYKKGVASTMESAPATLSARNPYTMSLYFIANAASQYMDETLENPNIPRWKRASKAIASAAFEQAVEKFADPIFKYIGGGKAASNITEDAAREILEEVTSEATESIAKRIVKKLGKIGKNVLEDAAGEGVEEFVTSAGTDAIGSALDAIDKNSDYGFKAQWEKFKEQNPNATKEDFARLKAEEYTDSFIGGALSGANMAGATQIAATGAQHISNKYDRNTLQSARNYGAALDYGNMYDTDSDVANAYAELEQSFVNEKGEAVLSADFLAGLSANDALLLSQRDELSGQQRGALAKYANFKAVQEGLEQKLDERTIAQINKSRELIDSATNEDGTIIAGNAEGRNVYVVDAQLENGVVTTPYGNSPVIVIDANTGDKFYVPSNDVKDGRSIDSKVLMGQIEQTLLGADQQAREVARNTMSPRAKIKAIHPFAGKKILVDLGNGTAEVYVQQIDANGNVLIKGKKGDLGGQTFLNLGGAAFYDSIYRDNDGNPVVTEAGPEVEEQVDEVPDVEVADAYDFRDYVGPILINGVPVDVEVTQQDDASDTIVYTYVDENGVTRRGSSSISEFKNAIVKPQEETDVTPEPAPVDETPETPEPAPEVDETPIEEVGEAPAPQPIDWDALFESDKEAFFSELQNYFGENAAIMLEDFIEATQNELDELNKAKVSGFNEIAANREAKAKVQTRLDILNDMLQRLALKPVEETPVAETPVAPVEEAPVAETPAPVEEAPAPVEETPIEETPVAETPIEEQPVEETPVEEAPVAETPVEPQPEPAPQPEPTPIPEPAPVEPEKKEGAIARLFNEFKAMVDKIAAKAAIKDFVGTDKTRPALTGIYKKGGYEYASDSHILVKAKSDYPAEQEGKIISPKTGQEIIAKYPDAEYVVNDSISHSEDAGLNVDDILAYAQTAEEIRKGLTKDTKILVKVGKNLFDSRYLITAAKMAKKLGLTTVMQHTSRDFANMVFNGNNGTVLVTPVINHNNIYSVIDSSNGEAVFVDHITDSYHLKVPATLKGIEATKTSLEAILPNLSDDAIDYLKRHGILEFKDGKVVYRFDARDISDVKDKAKDPNTFNALADIEKNGLVIPMSEEEIAKLFPETSGENEGESVPLGTKSEVDDNGDKGETPQGDTTVQRHRGGDIPRTSDGEGEGGNKRAKKGQKQAGKDTKGKKPVEDKYPARKGNATGKLLVDTFGLDSVTIPDSRKDTLNTIYDFMMEMAKTLGISPKSIGNGGWLGVANLRANNRATAAHLYSWRWNSISETVLKFKYARLTGIAHEWWHALDHALVFFNSGMGLQTATEMPSSFDGRKETLEAVKGVMDAIKASGHLDRIARLGVSLAHLKYLRKPTEQAARAFDQYIIDKFAAAGIVINGYDAFSDPSYPTAEEMKVIAPAFDKLFEVLKEKEGKTPGTSVLYQIGEQMEPNSDAKKFATEVVLGQLKGTGINVVRLSDEETGEYLKVIGVDPKTQFSIDTDKPIFLSNAAVAVTAIKQEKATPEQWLKMIEKNGGLKAGEDKWMGLSDWLKASTAKTLTKQEVLDYINENTIRIEEVNYVSENNFYEEQEWKQVDAINGEFSLLRDTAMDNGEMFADAGEIAYQEMVERYGDDFTIAFGVSGGRLYVSNLEAASTITGVELRSEYEINETRLQYTTDGLDNKREIALTVPTIEPWNESDEIHFGDAGDGRAVAWVRFGETEVTVQDATQQRLNEIYDRLDELEMKVSSTGITIEEYEERARLRDERDRLQEIEPKIQKVLVIDEIQSKRHQEGREKGYKSDFDFTKKEKDAIDRLESMYTRRGELVRERENNEESELTRIAQIDIALDEVRNVREYDALNAERDAIIKKREERANELNELRREIYRAEDELASLKVRYNYDYSVAIPDAPFDKNWHEIAMKRMLRYAAENGYDAIAWTKGEQQANRYSLTKYFNGIEREDNPNLGGRRFTLYGGNVETFNVDDNGVVTDSSINDAKGKPLSDVVGKELAVKMMSLEDGDIIEGEDIAVGGEGMKGFYDKMLPAFMNKYGKKWGVKVSDIELPNVEEAGRVMHSVPVTAEMKASVMEGQPMFYKTPNGIVYGWTDGKDIYLTEAGMNPNTPVHEYTHLWAKAMMLKNPKGWNSVKSLLKNTPVWNEVLNDVNYSDIRNDEDAVASEVLSRISGTENAAKLEQMAQQMIDEAKGTARKLEARGLVQNIKDALNKFWGWVGKELFGIEKFESIEEVTDRVLWDLMNQTDLDYENNSLFLQENENNETSESPRSVSSVGNVPGLGWSSNAGNGGITWNDLANYTPISQRTGESDQQRHLRQQQFDAAIGKFTSDERLAVLAFLYQNLNRCSGALKAYGDKLASDLRATGYNDIADFIDNFILDELQYREVESSNLATKFGFHIGSAQSIDSIEPIFNALNNDKYNGILFDRAIQLAKRFGVSVMFDTRAIDGGYINVAGYYEPYNNYISIDASFLESGREDELCQTILHEVIHSVVYRAAQIMDGRVSGKNHQYIDPNSLPKNVINGINMLKDVYNTIRQDNSFNGQYGKDDFHEMLSEISNPAFRALLKAKNVWNKIVNGIAKILGLPESGAAKSDALTETEKALDLILSSAERGELDQVYGDYLVNVPMGYTIQDLLAMGVPRSAVNKTHSSITPEMDAEYLAAVEAGDMETAQRLVDEAAKIAMPNTKVVDENGNPKVVYHQTNQKVYINRETGQNWNDVDWKEKMEWDERDDWEDYWEEQDFNTFSRVNARTTNEFDGFFFAPEYDEYHEYGDRTIPAFLNIENPASRGDYNIDASKNDAGRDERIRLQEAGFDGVIRMDGDIVDEYIAFEPSQIKSAEAVTYDDNGNVIPLSERFNPENPDIRYRTINDGETDLEFVESVVADFLNQYKSPVPMTAVDVNDRVAVEKAVGFEEGELSDESYQMLIDKVNKGGKSIYIADTKRILIFADARNEISAKVEDSAFHEITHALADKNPDILELGKWLWENADKGARKRVKAEVLSEKYPASQQHDEMLARYTGAILAVGRANEVSEMLPAEQKKHWDYILKEIGYEPRKDDGSRARRFADDSRRAAAIRQNDSAKVSDNGDARNAKEERQNEAVGRLVGTARSIAIENAVNEEAAKLGVKVTYKTREEMPKGHKNDKGYFNTKTGEIVVCTENASSISDAIQTILHEAVAHKGLRALMGDRFSEFINRVYESLDDATKAKVDSLAETKYNGNKAVAVEEYMASLAETMDFENKSVWEKIKEAFEDIINKILGRDDIKIGDNELRYILRASYNHMSNPRTMDTIEGWAKDKMMREEYGVNEAQPELMSRTGIDPTEASHETAKKTYDRVVTQQWQEFQRQFQDAMQPVRIAIDAIQRETGNIPIEDYENYLLIQNHSASRSRVETDLFKRQYYDPIYSHISRIIDTMLEARHYDKTDETKRAEAYAELKQYLIAKHGLERNKYYQEHNLRKLKPHEKTREMKAAKDAYDEAVRLINEDTNLSDTERQLELYKAKDAYDAAVTEIQTREVPDLRDYSGLTSLFGLDPKKFKEAEQEAQILVDEFEILLGSTNDAESEIVKALWEKINAATSRTLRHSYESGLISRAQYEEIKDMFKFYIPLRGFDETTAEDVYSYARFEGNSFNPAVQKAGGRTSVADDPIAFIMNMAESEIAQGNKNRAKQALYNYLLNRTNKDAEGNETQNSLMQVESVWYEVKEEDGQTVHVIATPDRAAGETYEEFENRMLALEQEDKAYKSKRGKVSVGMRFQKQKNMDAHYIYLKVNGVEKAIYVNGDPKAADAVNGKFASQPTNAEKMAKDVNRFISSMFTNYSLEFTVRNFLRDLVYSRINIGVKEDGEYGVQFRKNFWRNNPIQMGRMLAAYRAGEFDNANLTEDQAAFVEFMNNGGQTGYTLINSVENHKKDLERAIKRMQKGIVNGGIKDSTAFKCTLGAIEFLNEASELTTRFAAFKTSRDLGRPIHRSINDAKEISVNFNTKGAQDGNSVMGAIARYFGVTKYFFNASVQGVQNIGAMAQKNAGKFGATVGTMIAFGAMWPMINAAILSLITGDDEDEEYWKIPEYDRQNNFCIAIGNGKYVKIALPIGFREMFGIGDMAASALAGKTPRDPMRWGMDFANKIANIALPINPLEGTVNGLSLIESAEDMLIPDMAQFILQNRSNKDWKGAPIQKEYTYNQDDPQWTKAFSGNPAWLTGLCKWMNENFVGDGLGIDWSPEKIDNTMSNVFGGTYSLIKKGGRVVSSAINAIQGEEKFSISSIPVVGVFTGKADEDSFITSTYWNMEDYYSKRLPVIKRTAASFGYTLDEVFARTDDGEARAGEHHPEMSKIYNRKNFDFMQEWYLGHKGEGDEENLGLDQIKTQIERYKKAANKDEYDLEAQEMLAEYEMMMEAKRRDLVEDLLELD